tara:strand:+ start:266 stop:412 length:147 start_codon:yes stop_codon:yes gene_type:complete
MVEMLVVVLVLEEAVRHKLVQVLLLQHQIMLMVVPEEMVLHQQFQDQM